MTEMVERVKRTLLECPPGESMAVAAIDAMRPPTPAMLKAYSSALKTYISSFTEAERKARWGKQTRRGYQVPEWEKAAARYNAMIDAALLDGPTVHSKGAM